MKKTIAVIMALIMVVLLCACGDAAMPSKKLRVKDTNSSSGEENQAEEEYGVTVEGDALSAEATLETLNLSDIDSVEQGTSKPTLSTPWNATGMVKSGKSDAQADALRNKVLNAKNTAEIYSIKGTTYYVSPNGNDDNDGKSPATAFKTTSSAAFTSMVKPGDAVLFERGGLWRLTGSIRAREGVTYGSYGVGEKPTFYMSPYNYARAEFWLPSTRANIWKISAADTDIGLIVFNDGELVGVKKSSGIISLEKNGDYYYNAQEDTVYVYFDKGNPGKYFTDIEIGFRKSIITVTRAKNVTIDNLKLKYGGTFGISLSNSDGSTITNCEIGFIGGAYQNVSQQLRYGNGIQQWNSVYNQKITDNWIYQVYDTGITWQGDYDYTINNDDSRIDQYKNINYSNNLIEYCSLSIEFWHAAKTDEDSKNKICAAPIENFNCSDNICRFAGYGWGVQRSDHAGYHICVYERAFKNSKNNRITNNIFDMSYSYMVRWNFTSVKNNVGFTIANNEWYQRPAKLNEGLWYGSMLNATSQSTLENAVKIFDKSPKHVEWIAK